MTNALSIYNQFDQIKGAAIALQKSGFFSDIKSEAQAIVKVMAGAELGLPPFASMTGISIIQGKPVIGANLIATLVKNDPRYDYRIKQADAVACWIEFFENGQSLGDTGFTMAEATAAGLAIKDNWKKYPSDMLFARAISRGAKRHCPGIFGGSPVYTADEMGMDSDPEGYIDVRVVEHHSSENATAKDQYEYNTTDDPMLENVPPAGDEFQAMTYEDGSTVTVGGSAKAQAEKKAFGEYVTAHDGKVPVNVFNLRSWMKNQTAA